MRARRKSTRTLFGNIFNEKSIIAVLEYSEGYGLDSSHPYTFVSSGNSLYLYDIDNLDEDISFKKLLDFDSPVTELWIHRVQVVITWV